ncbi:hypothetical protein ALC56_01687 [Trachymyrmex septentrionalis]|uniref:Uncharacterized protein n=1 Tax=Trachymyrmex septentrionalis TaxID=34720 RepID=A0A195FTM9_9HYME|nr:hypothetical protein ALC56_01687 [Trachymyrmex septentrionalis]
MNTISVITDRYHQHSLRTQARQKQTEIANKKGSTNQIEQFSKTQGNIYEATRWMQRWYFKGIQIK